MARKRTRKKEQEPVMLKVSGAFVLDGEVVAKGELVEVTEAEARRLLARGKVTLATKGDTRGGNASNGNSNSNSNGGGQG